MDLIIILKEALCSDEKIIKESELKINNIASQNFGLFLIELADILANEGAEKGIRQISATIIKNMILYNQLFHGRYLQLDPQMKIQIKDRVLSTLASSDKDVRRAAALAVVGILYILFFL
jgi:Importin-beta N-terminal domain